MLLNVVYIRFVADYFFLQTISRTNLENVAEFVRRHFDILKVLVPMTTPGESRGAKCARQWPVAVMRCFLILKKARERKPHHHRHRDRIFSLEQCGVMPLSCGENLVHRRTVACSCSQRSLDSLGSKISSSFKKSPISFKRHTMRNNRSIFCEKCTFVLPCNSRVFEGICVLSGRRTFPAIFPTGYGNA